MSATWCIENVGVRSGGAEAIVKSGVVAKLPSWAEGELGIHAETLGEAGNAMVMYNASSKEENSAFRGRGHSDAFDRL